MAIGDGELYTKQATSREDVQSQTVGEQLGQGIFVQADYANTLYTPRPAFRDGTPSGRQETPVSAQDRAIYGASGTLLPTGQPYLGANPQIPSGDVPRYPTAVPGYQGPNGYNGGPPPTNGYPETRIQTTRPVDQLPTNNGGWGLGRLIDMGAIAGANYYAFQKKLPDIIKENSGALSPTVETPLVTSGNNYNDALMAYRRTLSKRYGAQSDAFEEMAKEKGVDTGKLLSDEAAFSSFKDKLELNQQEEADIWRSYKTEYKKVSDFSGKEMVEKFNNNNFKFEPIKPSIPINERVAEVNGINPWAVEVDTKAFDRVNSVNTTADVFRTNLTKAVEEQTGLASKLRSSALGRAVIFGVGDLVIDNHYNSQPGLLTSAADAGWAYGLVSSVQAVGRLRSTALMIGGGLLTHAILRSSDK
jgi:hypothetical protein